MAVDAGSVYMDVSFNHAKIAKDLERGVKAGADKAATDFDSRMSRLSSTANMVGTGIAVGLGAGLVVATKKAADLEQAVGGTAAVFKDQQKKLETFAKGAAEAVGLSETAARQFTTQIGAALKGYGFTVDQAADKSIELTKLGADLAATFGGTTTDAVTALGAALRGEYDPLERFGVAINATLVNQKAVQMGLATSTENVSQNAKAQAGLALITERSADAQGQFAREATSASGAAQIAAAKTENAAADLGQSFLPIYSKISEVVGLAATGFAALPGPVQTGTIALVGLAAVAGPLRTTLGMIGPATVAMSTAFDAAAARAYVLAGNLGTVALRGAAAGVAIGGLIIAVGEYNDMLNDNAEAAKLALDPFRAQQAKSSYADLVTSLMKATVARKDLANAPTLDRLSGGNQPMIEQLEKEMEVSRRLIERTGQLMKERGLSADAALAAARSEKEFAGVQEAGAQATKISDDALKKLNATFETHKDTLDKTRDKYDTVLNARMSLATGQLDVRSADRDVRAAQRDLNDLMRTGTATSDEIEAAQDRVTQAVIRRGQAEVEQVDRVRVATTGAHISATEQANIYNASVDATIAKFGLWNTKIGEVKVSLDGLPKQLQIELVTKASKLLVAGLEKFFNTGQSANLFSIIPEGEGRAAGGPVAPGMAYPVNERGVPELLNVGDQQYLLPTAPGAVIPMDKVAAKSGTTNVFQTRELNARQLAAEVGAIQSRQLTGRQR